MAVTTYTWMSAPTTSSGDAAFRKWAQGIHDSFVNNGWVQTTDTGQVNLASMVVPAVNTAAGYEVFRLNDVLQGAAPIFVKIEYGVGASASAPTIWLTVGQSTNGAGVVGSVLLARAASNSTGTGIATEYASYSSGDGSSICLSLWPASTSQAVVFLAIERSRDTSGAATGSGFLIVFGCYASQSVSVIGNGGAPGTAKSAVSPFLNVCLPYTINGLSVSVGSTLSKDGVTAPVLPVPCMAPGVPPWVSNVLVAVHPGDAGATSVIQAATINGQTRTYRAWPSIDAISGVVMIGPGGASLTPSASRCRPAIIWAV